MLIARFAGSVATCSPFFTATVVFAKLGMNSLTGVASVSAPSSIRIRMATLVSALDCDAIRKIESVAILRLLSLSLHPNALS